jgi:hypothetical protein
MRRRLVERLLEPGSLGPYPVNCGLSQREALGLAAQFMKAAYPDLFPATLGGEAVRLDLQYHEQMKSRPPAARPRYSSFD